MLDSFLVAFKKTGLHKLRHLLRNKYQAELVFQKNWVSIFLNNPEATWDYWVQCLCLPQIRRLCGIKETTKVLSVGCSPSTVLQFIEGNKYAVDPLADEYLRFDYPKLLHPYDDIELRKGFGEFLPYYNEAFDVVFCTNVLDHASNPSKVVAEVHRVLRNNGYFVLVVETFSSHKFRDIAHPHCFMVEDVLELVNSFEVVFKRVVVWNPHVYYSEALDFSKTDLVLVLQKQ